jgi:hypothetical protein
MRHRTETMIDICSILLLEQTNAQNLVSPVTRKRPLSTPWAPHKVRRTTNDKSLRVRISPFDSLYREPKALGCSTNILPDMSIYDDITVDNFQPYDWKTLARNIPLLAYLNGAQK